MSRFPPFPPLRRVPVVLSSTALTSFMSTSKAAALAFAELGAGGFVVVGVAQPVLGDAAPWFVLAAWALATFLRSVDIESWSLFMPGGLVGRAEQAFGPRAARFAAASVLAERCLLAALASVVVAHYAADVAVTGIFDWPFTGALRSEDLAEPFALLLLGVLWIQARLGRETSAHRAAFGVWMGVAILVAVSIWGIVSLSSPMARPFDVLRPALPPTNPRRWVDLGVVGRTLIGLALVLPMAGGGDVLARVASELSLPRVSALRRTTVLVVLLAGATAVVPAALFVLLVPLVQQPLWTDAPVAGLAHALVGPHWLRDASAVFLFVAAFLVLTATARGALSEAVQTLRRLAQDRALPERFGVLRGPFGTLTSAIDAAAAGAAAMILAGGTRVSWLARAYVVALACTIVWRTTALARLRWTRREPRSFVAPFNVRVGARTWPIGLVAAALLVASSAIMMLATADLPSLGAAGLVVGLGLVVQTPRRRGVEARDGESPDAFELLPASAVSLGDVDARPGGVLVPVRSPHRLAHLATAFQAAGDRDVIVMTVRLLGVDTDEEGLNRAEPTASERALFAEVIAGAERHHGRMRLAIVPAHDVFDAVVTTVVRLQASEIYVGESTSLPATEQARLLGDAWERAEKPDGLKARLVVCHHSGRTDAYHLGAHPPSLTAGDLDLIHRVWLDAVKAIGPHVHHHDVVRAALTQMEHELKGPQRDEALTAIREVARPADELAAAVRATDFTRLRDMARNRPASELAGVLTDLSIEDQVVVFRVLPRRDAAAVFEYLSLEAQEHLLKAMAQEDVAALLNNMAPDDRTMFLEELPAAATRQLLALLTPAQRSVALSLLGYPEDSIGRLMTPHYVAVHEDWTIREVLDFIRTHGQDSETLNVVYVVDEQGMLIDDLRIRELLLTSPDSRVSDLMDRRFVALEAADTQQSAVAEFRRYDRTALPVTDSAGMLIGIVTIDDVLDVAEAAATKEIQRVGGSEALDEPYMQIAFWRMIQKRAGWLTALFLGEMLTATAMSAFEEEISRAVVLALFVPLIISSGGNSGSQASTLVIRALALGEVGLADWWRVMRRELLAGLSLGAVLGAIGFLRITLWSAFSDIYGPHWMLVAVTVALALVGIVLWGTLIGSLLPFLLRRLGFDPATSSAPFVATLVDVTGLVIYFTVALVVLRGTLL